MPRSSLSRILPVIAGLGLLVWMGCSLDDEADNPRAVDERAVRILSPAPYCTLEVRYQWRETEDPYAECPWSYRGDTVFTALVVADIPSGAYSARAVTDPGSGGNYYGQTIHPPSDTFQLAFYEIQTSYNSFPPTFGYRSLSFDVRVTAGNGSSWTSVALPFVLHTTVDTLADLPPAAPLVDTLREENNGSLNLRWCNQAPLVNGFLVNWWCGFDGQVDTAFVHANPYGTQFSLHNYLPLTDYAMWVTAENEMGISPPSDTLWITSREPVLPYNVTARIRYPRLVEISWNSYRDCDSTLIGRRDSLGTWATIRALRGDFYSGYTDSTAAADRTYYYRVGLLFRNGTWWSEDSVIVMTP